MYPHVTATRETWFSAKLLEVLTIRGEQNGFSRESGKHQEEKEEPSGKLQLTLSHNAPRQTSSPHHTGLSCESCLSDGRSSALPESHTGKFLSTPSATARFWVQIFWSVPEVKPRIKHRDWNVFIHWSSSIFLNVGPDFQRRHLQLHLQNLHTCKQVV